MLFFSWKKRNLKHIYNFFLLFEKIMKRSKYSLWYTWHGPSVGFLLRNKNCFPLPPPKKNKILKIQTEFFWSTEKKELIHVLKKIITLKKVQLRPESLLIGSLCSMNTTVSEKYLFIYLYSSQVLHKLHKSPHYDTRIYQVFVSNHFSD